MIRDTSVYVHFPWCLAKCPYCDFATRGIERARIPHAAYADAIAKELAWRAPSLAGRRLVSVFFGGGTPSLWEPRELGRALLGIVGAFDDVADELEVTVECNPSSLDRERAAALREAGVGRLSIGVQSLDDARLRFLGRLHDASSAVRAVEAALAEVPRVSADLMFGLPGQSVEALDADIDGLVQLGLAHVSAYALTIEPSTQFGELARKGRLEIAKDDAVAELFERARERFARAGLAQYEVSNYARPGEEARHNLHYWRGLPYVGLGAAAVGCLDQAPGSARRWRNASVGESYIDACEQAGSAGGAAAGAAAGVEEKAAGVEEKAAGVEEEEERLDANTLVREALMLGLRTMEGTDLEATRARAGIDPLAGRENALARAMAAGDVVRDADRLTVPRDRWLRLDGIIARLF